MSADTAARTHRRHHRRLRRHLARDHPHDPLARRAAFAVSSAQTKIRRTWMPHSRGSPRRDAQHGKPVVRCGHRGLVEPHGDTYGSRKNLERAPCRIARKRQPKAALTVRV